MVVAVDIVGVVDGGCVGVINGDVAALGGVLGCSTRLHGRFGGLGCCLGAGVNGGDCRRLGAGVFSWSWLLVVGLYGHFAGVR